MNKTTFDYLITGAGIVGMAVARSLSRKKPGATVLIIEKEQEVAQHASGRNSGVLHAGFYYTKDSLKARFTVAGNKALKSYCKERGLPLNECGKLVVAANEEELKQLYELEERGKTNGAAVRLISETEARAIEPNARTFDKALYSPTTATIDPRQVCAKLKQELISDGTTFLFNSAFLGRRGRAVITSSGTFEAGQVINCAGLYADKVARHFGFGLEYTLIPFKGLYLPYVKNSSDVRISIYPVPNLRNPFLGVHFTKTYDGHIKIGPTATPAFWRENYGGIGRFNAGEFLTTIAYEALLLLTNSFGFRTLALEEIKKYRREYLISLASRLVRKIDAAGFGSFSAPGIRAQLLHKKTLELVQDFVIEGDRTSVHILNAVSPGFTCSFPFADYVVENHIV